MTSNGSENASGDPDFSPDQVDNCPRCRGIASLARVGEPCTVCGKELTLQSYAGTEPGMCLGCLASYRWPKTESTQPGFGSRGNT